MAPHPSEGGGGGSIISTIILFGIIFGIGYFVYRKVKKKRHTKIKRVKSDKNNDTV